MVVWRHEHTLTFYSSTGLTLGVVHLCVVVGRQIDPGSTLRDSESARRADAGSEEEARLKSEVSRGLSNVDRDRAIVASTREKVAAYEEGFNKIRAATGISTIEELVTTFIQNEVRHWSRVRSLCHSTAGLCGSPCPCCVFLR